MNKANRIKICWFNLAEIDLRDIMGLEGVDFKYPNFISKIRFGQPNWMLSLPDFPPLVWAALVFARREGAASWKVSLMCITNMDPLWAAGTQLSDMEKNNNDD